MTNSFPKNVFLEGIFEPLSFECDLNNLKVIGEIPKALNGTFYRNGPNPQYVYSKNYHMWEGDGMIHALKFDQGQLSYQNRWVRTERFLAQSKAKKGLFGGMRDFMACDDSVKNSSRNTANTNVICHHGTLLALNEGAQPVQIEFNDLGAAKTYTFNQKFERSMMAHPKIDPVTGELLFYSYFGPDFSYFIADKNGLISHQEKITMPFSPLMHDFAITENYTIFPLFPLTWDFQRVMRRENIFKWEPHLNSRFAIMPRYGKNEDVLWFEIPACLAMHTINAFEQGDKIILDMVAMDDIPNQAIAFEDDSVTYANYLTRWVFDLKTGKASQERLDNMNVEFPRVDERFNGRQYRHAYKNGTVNKALDTQFDSIVHYDLKTGEKQIHNFGVGAFPLEPVFVPRSMNAPEGDGFLLSYVYRESSKTSDLVILDAQHLRDKPLAIIQLPHRVPYGFHGCWVNKGI